MTDSPKLTMEQQDALISTALRSALWLRHVAGYLDLEVAPASNILSEQLRLEAGYVEEAALAVMLAQNEHHISNEGTLVT